MSSKLMIPSLITLLVTKNFTLEPQSVVGAVKLTDLPDNFVIQSMSVHELAPLTAGSTIALGEDGGGSANGYLAAVDLAAATVVRCKGALLYNGTDKEFIEKAVVPANDGLQLTSAVNPIVAGEIAVYVTGFQAF